MLAEGWTHTHERHARIYINISLIYSAPLWYGYVEAFFSLMTFTLSVCILYQTTRGT